MRAQRPRRPEEGIPLLTENTTPWHGAAATVVRKLLPAKAQNFRYTLPEVQFPQPRWYQKMTLKSPDATNKTPGSGKAEI
jgi:hypothetical protein